MISRTSNVSTKNFFLNSSKKIVLLENRKEILLKIAEAIAFEYSKKAVVNLNFICTHNSRRSQLGQIWSFFAANYFKLNINAFSGGTEVTAFDNPINIEPFIAITTCNNADKNCPFLPSVDHRFHLPFIDPKASDGTEKQEETYLKTNQQIAAEIYFIFDTVKKLLS